MKIYNSYMFRDKDPIIDVIRTLMKDEGLTVFELSKMSGLSVKCLHGWFDGKIRFPHHNTAKAAIRAMGYEYEVVSQVRLRKSLPPRVSERMAQRRLSHQRTAAHSTYGMMATPK
jgi:hypothetical protein